jgi:hypothetical protein
MPALANNCKPNFEIYNPNLKVERAMGIEPTPDVAKHS